MTEITEGPTRIFGYDGKVHPERAAPWEWRSWRLNKARERGTHTKEQWLKLRDRVGSCAACGATDRPLVKDHIYPISRGGCDCIGNIQPLCASCNSGKGARLESLECR